MEGVEYGVDDAGQVAGHGDVLHQDVLLLDTVAVQVPTHHQQHEYSCNGKDIPSNYRFVFIQEILTFEQLEIYADILLENQRYQHYSENGQFLTVSFKSYKTRRGNILLLLNDWEFSPILLVSGWPRRHLLECSSE